MLIREIIDLQQDLHARMPKIANHNIAVTEEQIAFSHEKEAFALYAFKKYKKIKNDPRLAMDAVELLMIALEEGSGEAAREIFERSVNKDEIPNFVVDKADSLDDRFKKGMCHLLGLGSYVQSNEAAIQLFAKPARNKHARAAYLAGWLHYAEKVAGSGLDSCENWLQLAADSSYAPAQYLLGELNNSDDGIDEYYPTAVKYLRMAANQFDASAQVSLGQMYEQGEGVKEDQAFALKWYLLASHQGSVLGQYLLGKKYRALGEEGSKEEARDWLTKSAAQGYTPAKFILGEMYELGELGEGVIQDKLTAVNWYYDLAEQGEVIAQYCAAKLLKELCQDYRYQDKHDIFKEHAARWLKNSAKRHIGSQYELSLLYRDGFGVNQDMTKFLKWCQRAAMKNYGRAQLELFNYYTLSRAPDAWLAARWRYHALQNGVSPQEITPSNWAFLNIPDYSMAIRYYDALLNNDAHMFLNVLKENDKTVPYLFSELEEPFFAGDGMFERITELIDSINLTTASEVNRRLINHINAQIAIINDNQFNAQIAIIKDNRATNNVPRDEKAIRDLHIILQKINYADVSGQQAVKLLELIINVRMQMSLYTTFSGDKKIENDLIDAMVQLVARIKSLSSVNLETGLMRLCAKAIIRSRIGPDYELAFSRDGMSKEDFYLLVELVNRKFTVEKINIIFDKKNMKDELEEVIVKVLPAKDFLKEGREKEAEKVKAASSASSSSSKVSVGEMNIYNENNKRKREEESVNSEEEKQNGEPEHKRARL